MAGLKFSMKMEGLEEIRRALRKLPEELQAKELAHACRKGGAIIRDDAKPRVLPDLREPDKRRKPGTLRKAIRSTAGRRHGSVGSAFVYVRRLGKKAIAKFKAARRALGQRIKSSDNPDDPFYWSVLEFSSSSKKARPFLRPAFEAKKVAAAESIKDNLRKGIEKQAAKLAGKKRF